VYFNNYNVVNVKQYRDSRQGNVFDDISITHSVSIFNCSKLPSKAMHCVLLYELTANARNEVVGREMTGDETKKKEVTIGNLCS